MIIVDRTGSRHNLKRIVKIAVDYKTNKNEMISRLIELGFTWSEAEDWLADNVLPDHLLQQQ